MTVFSTRLKYARTVSGMSQEQLGIKAGVDPMSASARLNQYERGRHAPDFAMVERIATALNVPEAYFYTKDDAAAWLLVAFHRMSRPEQDAVLRAASKFF